MSIKLKNGEVKIEMYPDVAPKHVERIKKLADEGKYDNVVFHRVIDGFMAQTGDVQFGNSSSDKFDLNRAGTGGSNLPDLPAELRGFMDNINREYYRKKEAGERYKKFLEQQHFRKQSQNVKVNDISNN